MLVRALLLRKGVLIAELPISVEGPDDIVRAAKVAYSEFRHEFQGVSLFDEDVRIKFERWDRDLADPTFQRTTFPVRTSDILGREPSPSPAFCCSAPTRGAGLEEHSKSSRTAKAIDPLAKSCLTGFISPKFLEQRF
jgi:hypothetical protein